MRHIIIPANPKKYNHKGSFLKNGFIDWVQTKPKCAVGDIVYIYCGKPIQRLCYKTIVKRIDMDFCEIVDDSEFWSNHEDYEAGRPLKFARLELLQFNDKGLSLEELKGNGCLSQTQSGCFIKDERQISFIESSFEGENLYPEVVDDSNCFEGAIQRVSVNRYERSQEARVKCIAFHGCKCKICGFDFEKMYGELGKDFIHVHHIVPLSEISKEYEVDPIRDLIPVCPNCHAMLHRSKKDALDWKELRTIVQNKRGKG